MKPRAFVVMPFGQKTPLEPLSKPHQTRINYKGRSRFRDRFLGFIHQKTDSAGKWKIDFDRVYSDLFVPALQQAGYEVARGDSEMTAGDIRTDMFFELVTADLVVADISILNPNVYYELGVRHGVCPRGVFIVNGSFMASRPFDIAPDRSFSYEAAMFTESIADDAKTAPDEDKARLQEEVERLAKKFRDASALDRELVGSPVYAHLPGLKPVDWEGIETSKAKYFNALQSDWLDCVRNAQANGHPGDILTLAMNAPTRLHETRIRYEAAIALIDLCRYAAAEHVLRDVVQLDPQHTDAQVHLALVLSRLGHTIAAEHQLRKILQQHKDDPRAADLLSQVFRHLWHLSWQDEPVADRREKAKNASQLAISAIHSFSRAHRSDPRVYFAGFNALMLAHVLRKIGVLHDNIRLPQARDAPGVDIEELKTLVRYAAANKQQQAIEDGNYVEQFWCTTTLAGILFVDAEFEAAITKIREACAIPAATSFQLQTFRDRLKLLAELQVECEFVQSALEIVDRAIERRSSHCSCERVFLWSGYAIDEPKRHHPRFPGDRVQALKDEIKKALQEWGLNSNDLGICGGMTESDIIFAEACRELDARVRIMLCEPTEDEPGKHLWPFASSEWRQRFHQLLLPGGQKEIWIDTKHLGALPAGSVGKDRRSLIKRRHKQWLINTAQMEAAPVVKPSDRCAQTPNPTPLPGRLYGLFLWDGSSSHDDPDDSSCLIRDVNEFEAYQGEVKIISPQELSSNSKFGIWLPLLKRWR